MRRFESEALTQSVIESAHNEIDTPVECVIETMLFGNSGMMREFLAVIDRQEMDARLGRLNQVDEGVADSLRACFRHLRTENVA